MNKQALLELLKNPGQISESDLKGLEKMVEAFPYFQAAHALLAKAAKKNGEMHADRKVRKAAVYTGERKILKKLLTDKQEHEIKKQQISLADLQTAKQEVIEKESEKSAEVKTFIPDVKEQPVKKEEKQQTDTEKYSGTATSGNDRFYDELQENLRKLRDMRAKLAAGLPAEEKKTKDKGTSETSSNFSKEPEQTEKSEKPLMSEKIKEHDKDSELFTSRLDEVVGGKKDRRDAIDEGELLLNYLSFLEMNKNTGNDKKSTDEIIERFIKQEPSISKLNPGILPEEQEDKASASYQLKTNLASENMARIMLLQGRKDKAIEIYEQLILKYPEKKAYFVAQIEKIKEK